METWEMIKEWYESDMKKEFKCPNPLPGQFQKTVKNCDGQLCWNGSPHAPLLISSDNHNWELVPKEIPWQEALGRWVKGESVIRELNGTTCLFTKDNCFGVSRKELINGKWFLG